MAYKQTGKIYNKYLKNNINKTVYKKNSFNPNNLATKKQIKILYLKSNKAIYKIFYK